MLKTDSTEKLCAQVSHAFHAGKPLRITAGKSKSFYGRKVAGEEILVAGHSGIIEYRASELVLTARSGTRLSEIEDALAENQQMLAYEPPIHDPHSTLGGSIACGLSGPRRPYAGAARDFVLGTTIINGKGERLKFGGQVMKNVAGYDASRLMTGAQGTLGVLLDISIKVLPRPGREITLCFEQDFEHAHSHLRQWILQGHPITASCYIDDQLFVRLSSTVNGVKSAHATMGMGLPASPDTWFFPATQKPVARIRSTVCRAHSQRATTTHGMAWRTALDRVRRGIIYRSKRCRRTCQSVSTFRRSCRQ